MYVEKFVQRFSFLTVVKPGNSETVKLNVGRIQSIGMKMTLLLSYKNEVMVRAVDTFTRRFSIKGMSETTRFTFHLLRGQNGIRYKVRTDNPESDFDLHSMGGSHGLHFVYSHPATLPEWLRHDKELQTKMSNAIKFEMNK